MCEPKLYAELESRGRVIYGFETRTQTKFEQPPKKPSTFSVKLE